MPKSTHTTIIELALVNLVCSGMLQPFEHGHLGWPCFYQGAYDMIGDTLAQHQDSVYATAIVPSDDAAKSGCKPAISSGAASAGLTGDPACIESCVLHDRAEP
jgi:hypothetical protein